MVIQDSIDMGATVHTLGSEKFITIVQITPQAQERLEKMPTMMMWETIRDISQKVSQDQGLGCNGSINTQFDGELANERAERLKSEEDVADLKIELNCKVAA